MAGEGVSPDEIVPPPPKKLKAETSTESDTSDESDEFITHLGRKYRRPNDDDPEYKRQLKQFFIQFERSKGFEIEWDKFDYPFVLSSVALLPRLEAVTSNDDIIHDATIFAINEYNKLKGTHLEFFKKEKANLSAVTGFTYYITFWAKDMSSGSEAIRYQAEVWEFNGNSELQRFRVRPTDEEMDSVEVKIPPSWSP